MKNYLKLLKMMLLEYEGEKSKIEQKQEQLDQVGEEVVQSLKSLRTELEIEKRKIQQNQERLDRIETLLSTEYENEKLKVKENQERLDRIETLLSTEYENEKLKVKKNQERLDQVETLLSTEYTNEKLKICQNQERLDTLEKTVFLCQREMDFLFADIRGGKGGRHFHFFDKTTNSQSGEDAILFHVIMMLEIPFKDCTYLDLGANRPVEGSNTNFFYVRGARGVLVEANPELIPSLRDERSEDVILNKCVDTEDGKIIEFIIMTKDGLSTVNEEEAGEVMRVNPEVEIKQRVQVESISINTIMETYFADKPPVICSIDIEGKDMEILQSINFEQYRPLLIVIEMIPYAKEMVIGKKNMEIYDYMSSVGYAEYAFTGINSIFIDKKALREKWGYKF